MSDTSNLHIFICEGFSTFGSQSPFYHPVKARWYVSLGWACFEGLYLANLVENIPLWTLFYDFLFSFFLDCCAWKSLFSERSNKTVLLHSAQKTFRSIGLIEISDFSSSIEMSVEIRLKHDISPSFCSEQPMVLNQFSLTIQLSFLIFNISTTKIDDSLTWVKGLLMLKYSSLKPSIDILIFELKSLISSCPIQFFMSRLVSFNSKHLFICIESNKVFVIVLSIDSVENNFFSVYFWAFFKFLLYFLLWTI